MCPWVYRDEPIEKEELQYERHLRRQLSPTQVVLHIHLNVRLREEVTAQLVFYLPKAFSGLQPGHFVAYRSC